MINMIIMNNVNNQSYAVACCSSWVDLSDACAHQPRDLPPTCCSKQKGENFFFINRHNNQHDDHKRHPRGGIQGSSYRLPRCTICVLFAYIVPFLGERSQSSKDEQLA